LFFSWGTFMHHKQVLIFGHWLFMHKKIKIYNRQLVYTRCDGTWSALSSAGNASKVNWYCMQAHFYSLTLDWGQCPLKAFLILCVTSLLSGKHYSRHYISDTSLLYCIMNAWHFWKSQTNLWQKCLIRKRLAATARGQR